MKIEVLAIIPARGGSKGVPRKNLKKLAGKPLIQHTIDIAKKVKLIDKIVVSTDDKEIADMSKAFGAEVIIRPKELAGDRSMVKDAIQYTVKTLEEKPVSRYIVSGGIYILDPNVLCMIPQDSFYDMPTLFEKLIQKKKKLLSFSIRERDYWKDNGCIDDYECANNDYQKYFK